MSNPNYEKILTYKIQEIEEIINKVPSNFGISYIKEILNYVKITNSEQLADLQYSKKTKKTNNLRKQHSENLNVMLIDILQFLNESDFNNPSSSKMYIKTLERHKRYEALSTRLTKYVLADVNVYNEYLNEVGKENKTGIQKYTQKLKRFGSKLAIFDAFAETKDTNITISLSILSVLTLNIFMITPLFVYAYFRAKKLSKKVLIDTERVSSIFEYGIIEKDAQKNLGQYGFYSEYIDTLENMFKKGSKFQSQISKLEKQAYGIEIPEGESLTYIAEDTPNITDNTNMYDNDNENEQIIEDYGNDKNVNESLLNILMNFKITFKKLQDKYPNRIKSLNHLNEQINEISGYINKYYDDKKDNDIILSFKETIQKIDKILCDKFSLNSDENFERTEEELDKISNLIESNIQEISQLVDNQIMSKLKQNVQHKQAGILELLSMEFKAIENIKKPKKKIKKEVSENYLEVVDEFDKIFVDIEKIKT